MTATALFVALVHYPVHDRNGDIVTTAVTNFDVHDIARASRTYGAEAYYLVNPIEAQRALVQGVVRHWLDEVGEARHPERVAALRLVRTAASVAEAVEEIVVLRGERPVVVATSARPEAAVDSRRISYERGRQMLQTPGARPWLLLFGTGWGMTADLLARADFVLPPIDAGTGYNHLSVRTAAAVVLDRLRGLRDKCGE